MLKKKKIKKKPQTSKIMNSSRRHPENTYKTTIDCQAKNLTKNKIKLKNKFFNKNNQKNENSNSEISFNNNNFNNKNRPKTKFDIIITNPTNTLKKNNSEFHHHLFKKYKNNIKTLSSKYKDPVFSQYNGFSDEDKNKETSIEDNDEKLDENHRNFAFSSEKKIKKKEWNNDPLNPYFINWQNSFLKIGYNVVFHYNEFQEGVPILRIQKLKKQVFLPPLYTVNYNKFNENKNSSNGENLKKLVCSKVANKVFSPVNIHSNYYKTKNSFHHHFNFSKKVKNKENEQKLSPRFKNAQNLCNPLYNEINNENNVNEITKEKNIIINKNKNTFENNNEIKNKIINENNIISENSQINVINKNEDTQDKMINN